MTTWVGRIRSRKGARWEAVCEAETVGQCARLLEAAGKRRGILARNQIMTGGGYPKTDRPEAPAAVAGKPVANEEATDPPAVTGSASGHSGATGGRPP